MIAASGGGPTPSSFTFDNINPSTADEGQTVDVFYSYANYHGETVYWTVYDYPSGPGQSGSNNWVNGEQSGSFTLNGSGSNYFYIYPKADNVTEGTWYYGIKFGTSPNGSDLGVHDWYQVNDTSYSSDTSLLFEYNAVNLPGTIQGLYTWGSYVNGFYGIIRSGTKDTAGGGSVVFNGSSTWVELPEFRTSNYPAISIGAWVNPSDVAASRTIMAKEVCYKLRINSDASVSFGVSNTGGGWTYTAITGAGAVSTGAWTHISATVNASHTTLYINGTQVAQTTGVALYQNTYPLVIGAYANTGGSPADYFAGNIADVKMWNYALNGSQITTEFNDTKSRYGL
jgi:hypothetical protein